MLEHRSIDVLEYVPVNGATSLAQSRRTCKRPGQRWCKPCLLGWEPPGGTEPDTL